MKIGVIGTGTIATAVVRGIAPDGHPIAVSRRNATNAAALAEAFENVCVADNQTVLDGADVILIGTTGDIAPEVLSPLAFRPGHIVISLMADLPLDRVAHMVAPAQAQAVMIPFPVIASGGSPVFTCPPSPLVTTLAGARNMVIPFDDASQMAPFMAAQATLSPVLNLVATAADWLSARTGDAGQAQRFLTTLIANTMQTATLRTSLAALDTPGGYNQRLRNHMETANAALKDGLDALEDEA